MLEEIKKKVYDSTVRTTSRLYDFSEVEYKDIPFSGHWGFSTNAPFKIAGKEARRGADFLRIREESAQNISSALTSDENIREDISEVIAVNGYVNVYLKEDVFAKKLLEKILYGEIEFAKKTERVMVEYSQPNTHHAFHIGHLRNVVLGQALVNIMRFAGYQVVAATYPGDIGIHVARCLWAYLKHHKGKEPPKEKGGWLAKLYVEGSKAFQESEEAQTEIRELNQRLESGEEEITKVWSETRKWSLEYFDRIYSQLGVCFDAVFFESDVMKEGKRIAHELLQKGVAEVSEGAVIVRLDEQLGTKDLGVWVILRSDGTTLYSTKDLALAKKKFEEYHIDRSVYVIGSEQKMHMRQLFATLGLWGFPQAKNCHHLSYELVMLKSGKMSSRAGNVVLYDDLYHETYNEAKRQIEEKGFVVENVEDTARKIALGAMKFTMLHDNNKVIIFDPQETVNFEGQTAAYIQYAYARASRILEKAEKGSDSPLYENLEDPEKNLCEMLSQFKGIIEEAAETYRPHVVSNYAFMLAKSFNEFYHSCPVLQAEEGKRKRRLLIVEATRKILGLSLALVGIERVERM